MAKKLEWVFSLVDKMSGPAKKAEKAIGDLGSKLEQLAKTEEKKPFRFLDGIQAASPRAKSAVERVTKPFGELQKAFSEAGASATPVAGKLGVVAGALGNVTVAAVAATGAVAALGAGLVAGASALAIKAATARKDLLIGFEAVTGSGKEAVQRMDEAGELAKKIGISSGVVQKGYLDMLRLGVKQKHAPIIAQGLADLAATMGDEREAVFGQLTKVVAEMSSTGKFDAGALKAVKTTLRTEDLEATLAKRLGVVPERVQKMLADGKVSAEEGIAALLETIQTQVNKGGALGTTAAKANAGLGSQWRIMRERFGDLFEQVDISPLERAMTRINELFVSERGAAVVEKINLVLGKVFQLVEEHSPKAIAWIEKGIGVVIWLTDKAQAAHVWLQKLFASDRFKTFVTGLKVIGAAIAIVLAPMLVAMNTFTVVAWTTIFNVVSAIGFLFSTIRSKIMTMIDIAGVVFEFFGRLKDRFLSIGSEIVDGLWEGIKSGWGWLKGKFTGLIDELPWAAKKALRIASPSRVMREIGGWTVEGFQLGLEDKAGGASSAMAAVVAPPSVSASGMERPTAAAPISVTNYFQVDGSQDPQATAAAIQDIAITGIASALEQLGIQSGAPVPT